MEYYQNKYGFAIQKVRLKVRLVVYIITIALLDTYKEIKKQVDIAPKQVLMFAKN